MHKYLITFKGLPGEELTISYNANARLMKIDASSAPGISVKQIHFLKQQIPAELNEPMAQLTQLIEDCKGAIEITQSEFDVDFNTFWEAYNYKRHKIPTQKLYEKLSYADKYKCITSIAGYDKYRSKKTWLEKMLPDTWISKREFDTEWKKIN
jgi:hypothetical protein